MHQVGRGENMDKSFHQLSAGRNEQVISQDEEFQQAIGALSRFLVTGCGASRAGK